MGDEYQVLAGVMGEALQQLRFVFGLLYACLGLVVPGLFLALRLQVPGPVFAAVPFSVVFIYLSVLSAQALDLQLSFELIASVLTACGIALAPRSHAGIPRVLRRTRSWYKVSKCEKDCDAALLVISMSVLLALLIRCVLHPLAGYDTPWRWDHLPRMMLRHGNLDFYPPITADDFLIYPYADGIAPFVASSYWFVYAGVGDQAVATTALILAQLVSCLGLTAVAARQLHGSVAMVPAFTMLIFTPLWWKGVAIGQETGYTAIAVAGQLVCGVAAWKSHPAKRLIAAGVFAGIAGCAREYGVVLTIPSIALALGNARTRVFLPAVAITMLTIASPWYLRNWLLVGNPLYNLPTVLGPAANPVHAGIMQYYAGGFGIGVSPASKIVEIVGGLASGAAPLLVGGLLATARSLRRLWACGLTAAVSLGLWVWSVQFTAGGIWYSMRVLSPLWVVLAVAGASLFGVLGTRKMKGGVAQRLLLAGALCWAGWNLLLAVSFPWPASRISTAWREVSLDPAMRAHLPSLFEALEDSPAPALGILTDDPYFAATLIQQGSRFRPVMIWSPAVLRLFDDSLSPADGNRLLGELQTPLAFICRGGPHWGFLLEHKFFREEEEHWVPWLRTATGEVETMPRVQP